MTKEEYTPIKIAVYGTLRQGMGNNPLLDNCTLIGSGLTVEEHGLYASGIPYVVENGGDWGGPKARVVVDVYEVPTLDQMDRVDSLEGYSPVRERTWYDRRPCQIEMEDGSVIDTQLYFMDVTEEQSKRLTYIESGDYKTYRQPYYRS